MTRKHEIYTPRGLATALKVPLRTVLRAIKDKKLTMIKFSSSTFRIEGDEVDRWLDGMKSDKQP